MAATARPSVDPRIRARRIEVQRDLGRRRLRRLTWLVAFLVLVAAAYGVTRTPLLAVHQVDISGNRHTSAVAIRDAAGLRSGAAMLDLSAGAAAHRIEALPWVATASVARDWPRTVKVTITERTAVAQVATGGQWLVIDHTGRVLSVATAASGGLSTIDWQGHSAAPGHTIAVPPGLLDLAAAMPADLRALVTGVRRDGGDLVLVVAKGVVRIGSATALRDKLVAAATLLATPAGACAQVIDVQVPTAPSLTPGAHCA